MLTMRRLYEIYNSAAERVAREEYVAFVDVEQFVTRNHDNQRHILFSDTCHPTAEGNVIIGHFVAERMWELWHEGRWSQEDRAR
jgi:hypothetical protein